MRKGLRLEHLCQLYREPVGVDAHAAEIGADAGFHPAPHLFGQLCAIAARRELVLDIDRCKRAGFTARLNRFAFDLPHLKVLVFVLGLKPLVVLRLNVFLVATGLQVFLVPGLKILLVILGLEFLFFGFGLELLFLPGLQILFFALRLKVLFLLGLQFFLFGLQILRLGLQVFFFALGLDVLVLFPGLELLVVLRLKLHLVFGLKLLFVISGLELLVILGLNLLLVVPRLKLLFLCLRRFFFLGRLLNRRLALEIASGHRCDGRRGAMLCRSAAGHHIGDLVGLALEFVAGPAHRELGLGAGVEEGLWRTGRFGALEERSRCRPCRRRGVGTLGYGRGLALHGITQAQLTISGRAIHDSRTIDSVQGSVSSSTSTARCSTVST